MERGARQATVHRVAKSQTWLKWLSTHVCLCSSGPSFLSQTQNTLASHPIPHHQPYSAPVHAASNVLLTFFPVGWLPKLLLKLGPRPLLFLTSQLCLKLLAHFQLSPSHGTGSQPSSLGVILHPHTARASLLHLWTHKPCFHKNILKCILWVSWYKGWIYDYIYCIILYILCLVVKSWQWYLTLFEPMDCSLAGSSVHWIPQTIILEWVTISSPRGSSQPTD